MKQRFLTYLICVTLIGSMLSWGSFFAPSHRRQGHRQFLVFAQLEQRLLGGFASSGHGGFAGSMGGGHK